MTDKEFDAATTSDGSFKRYVIPNASTCSSSSSSSSSSGSSSSSSSVASSTSAAVAAPNSVTGKFSSIETKYSIDSALLGTGYQAYAVRECTDRATGRRYAVKSIRKSPAVRMNDLHREVELLREVNHKNVLRLVDVFEDSERLHIVTDLCEGGELYDKIVQKRKSPGVGCFAEGDAARVLRQVLAAVSYLHGKGIVHRDLKPENILFATREEGSPIKIIDFGLARKHHRDSFEPHMSAVVGSSFFLAPEVLRRKYDKSCDLWSVGVITFIMLCGYPPFNGANGREVCDAVKRGKLTFRPAHWKGVSKEAKDFVRRLLRPNPRKRMTIEDALDHPWIVKHNAATSNEEERQDAEEVANERPAKRDSFLSFGGIGQGKLDCLSFCGIGQGKLRMSMFRS